MALFALPVPSKNGKERRRPICDSIGMVTDDLVMSFYFLFSIISIWIINFREGSNKGKRGRRTASRLPRNFCLSDDHGRMFESAVK